MPISTSKSSYADCFSLFDRAIESSNGIRNRCPSAGAARNLIVRLHYARTLSRRESLEVYDEDDPEYGVSPYDPFIVRLHEAEGVWWVYIEPRAVTGEVEELPAAE